MTVKLDEPLSAMVGQPLGNRGYAVRTVLEQGWGGLKDPQLWPRVVDNKEFFITADKGFGDLRAYPPGAHAGILVLRPDRESIVDFRGLVEAVLARHQLEDLAGCVTVVTPRSIRVRRKPLK